MISRRDEPRLLWGAGWPTKSLPPGVSRSKGLRARAHGGIERECVRERKKKISSLQKKQFSKCSEASFSAHDYTGIIRDETRFGEASTFPQLAVSEPTLTPTPTCPTMDL